MRTDHLNTHLVHQWQPNDINVRRLLYWSRFRFICGVEKERSVTLHTCFSAYIRVRAWGRHHDFHEVAFRNELVERRVAKQLWIINWS
jgi:hypothetical protein